MPSRNLDLIAQWEEKTYEVRYFLFEDEIDNPTQVPTIFEYKLRDIINKYERTPIPGYIFIGWFEAVSGEEFEFGIEMTEIITPYILFGKWTPISYLIEYDLNAPEGEVVEPSNPTEFTMEDVRNNDNTPIPLAEPSREGYDFDGWKDESLAGVGAIGSPGNKTLTAQWILKEYAITYHLDGGSFSVTDFPREYNIQSSFNLIVPIRTGYVFDGWALENGTKITAISPGMSGNIQLTAEWVIQSFQLTTVAYQGQLQTSVPKEFGSTLGLINPTRRGYSFSGWEDSSSGTRYNSDSTMPGNDLSLIGQWDLNEYTINYDLNDGTSNASFTYDYTILDSISIPTPTRTGWIFVGWDNADDGTANHTPASGTTTIIAGVYAEDLNFKAVWTQSIYTMRYDTAGGNDIEDKTFTFGQSLDNTYFPVPTKSGETFIGWFDSANRRWAVGSAFENIGPDGNLALTARWATFPYSITFDADNGEDSYSTSVYPGQPVYIGFTPYKEGYRFGGWMDLDDGTYYTKDSIMPTKNLTLTAQWIEL
jgi:uncharacterized repeat protein (TIGR02543 family)